MPQRILDSRYKILGHAFFWIVSIVLLTTLFSYYEQRFHLNLLIKSGITNLGFALGVYVNLLFLIPKFLKQKNYIFYIFGLIVLLTLSSLTIQLLFIFPFRTILDLDEKFATFNTSLHSNYFFATFAFVFATSIFKFIKDWLSLQDLNLKIAKIEQQKLEAELKTLKGQLNPHFLFNSLNNIYSLALIKSDKVPDLILKLSDLMRHIIYESKENYISLDKEIEFVNNFIALQKIRTSDQTKINYQINGEIPSAKIAPLIFEPFIDNAFKHGLPGISDLDFISIIFCFDQSDFLNFELKNNYEETENWNKKNSGIGVENVKQRLKLLYKKDEYNLKITRQNNIFTVQLKLKLK